MGMVFTHSISAHGKYHAKYSKVHAVQYSAVLLRYYSTVCTYGTVRYGAFLQVGRYCEKKKRFVKFAMGEIP